MIATDGFTIDEVVARMRDLVAALIGVRLRRDGQRRSQWRGPRAVTAEIRLGELVRRHRRGLFVALGDVVTRRTPEDSAGAPQGPVLVAADELLEDAD
ncbi:MAG: hypothetical protein R2862_04910 [Thermoanaerobaculia bacterium]